MKSRTPLFDELPEDQRNLILKHYELVMEANKMVNLTRIDTYEEGLVLHIEDSLCGMKEALESPEGMYADIGSGAGYPGIPLAIATGRKAVLIDSRKKKMDVVGRMIEELGLSAQISVYAGRAELYARKHLGTFSLITARALSKASVLLELSSPLLSIGGRLVCYKALMEDEELQHASQVARLVGMEKVSDRCFSLEGGQSRRLIAYEKIGEPKLSLPRLEGQAQKNPL